MLQFWQDGDSQLQAAIVVCVCLCVFFFVLDNIAKWKLTDSIAIRFDQTDGSKWEKGKKQSCVCIEMFFAINSTHTDF